MYKNFIMREDSFDIKNTTGILLESYCDARADIYQSLLATTTDMSVQLIRFNRLGDICEFFSYMRCLEKSYICELEKMEKFINRLPDVDITVPPKILKYFENKLEENPKGNNKVYKFIGVVDFNSANVPNFRDAATELIKNINSKSDYDLKLLFMSIKGYYDNLSKIISLPIDSKIEYVSTTRMIHLMSTSKDINGALSSENKRLVVGCFEQIKSVIHESVDMIHNIKNMAVNDPSDIMISVCEILKLFIMLCELQTYSFIRYHNYMRNLMIGTHDILVKRYIEETGDSDV